ncbi:hypothetical protein N9N67_08575 [Bacteriovoracaceae bacterium]|nr:hypothetical protein [Bacteriovoracaceae bacterium]
MTDAPLDWLEKHIGFEVFKSSLDQLKDVIQNWELDKIPKEKVISIVGTNGKGQVTHELARQLKSNGFNVFTFTSPHQIKLSERFQFNGQPIGDEEMLSLFETVHKKLSQEEARLSFFEFLYVVFLQWVTESDKEFDYVLFEAGLGGRLDATKCIEAHLVILTSIGRDHMSILGHSLKQILLEKLGILYPGNLLVYNLQLKSLKKILYEYTSTHLVKTAFVPSDIGSDFYNRNNNLVRYVVTKEFGKNYFESEQSPLREISWRNKNIYFNSAHNLDGVRNLFQLLNGNSYNRSGTNIKYWDMILLAFSNRSTEELKSMVKLIESYPCLYNKIKVVIFDHPRALSFLQAKDVFKNIEVEKLESIQFAQKENVLLLGSNYIIKSLASLSSTV